MGQRLVISIKRKVYDVKSISKIYYHWSGYTHSSLLEAQNIIEFLLSLGDLEKMPDDSINYEIIKHLEKRGGGIDYLDKEYIKKIYPQRDFKNGSRNNGIMSISEKEQKYTQSLSEGDIYIGLNDKKICNYVYSAYDSFSEFIKEEGIERDICEDNFKKIDYEIEKMDWWCVKKAISDLFDEDYIKTPTKYIWCIR